MAGKKKSKNSTDPLMALLAIPVAIFMFLKEHLWLAFLIAAVIAAVVIGVIISKKKKREVYLRWFYDRNRRITELNADAFMDVALTESIVQAAASGKTISVGSDTAAFHSLKDAYNNIMKSSDILQADSALSAQNTGRALTAANGIDAKTSPMILRYVGENNGGYVFYVFPETTLVFVEGPEQVVFIAAYYPTVLSLTCGALRYTLRPQVIPDKTQNPIRYYDRYCPVRDALIISSRWEVTNKDGSRSFRGGLLPENNPLHFTLKYGKLTVKLGDYSVDTSFSRYNQTVLLADAYNQFKTGSEPDKTKTEPVRTTRANTAPTNKKSVIEQSNVFTSVTTQLDDEKSKSEMPSVFTTTGTKLESKAEPIVEQKSVLVKENAMNHRERTADLSSSPKKSISVDDARYRNRLIANKIVQELNQKYIGQYDFKVYQVRKPRSDWALQDAVIYTYIKDSAENEYTIELNIRTDVDDAITKLEFYIWSKQSETVKARYADLVANHEMKLKSTGYHFIGETDYENESQITMENALRNDVLSLFAELVTW